MSLRVKFVFWIGLLGMLCLVLPGSLRANTIYTYTGPAYTSCSGTYTCNGTTPSLSITFETTLTGSQLDGLAPNTNILTDIIKFDFTDGSGLNLNQGNGSLNSFVVGTDSSGNITTWFIAALGSSPFQVADTCFGACVPSYFDDSESATGNGRTRGVTPGTWSTGTPVTATPEPSSVLLLGTGLLGLWALVARSKRYASPTSC
jgi:hypothetical protein